MTKFGLVWEEKPEEVAELCKEKFPILTEIKTKVIHNNVDSPNILIEGDNYHALSVLNYTHKGKIDLIYIDPPYNGGNDDFRYNDKIIDPDDSFLHSKWISFMSKRLKLAKKLLSKKGIILISIDENEESNLKLLCDDIFKGNFIMKLFVKVRYEDKTLVEDSDVHRLIETVLVYGKSDQTKINRKKKAYSIDKFIWTINEIKSSSKIELDGKVVEIFKKGNYKIIKNPHSKNYLKQIWASGKILDINSSGRFFRDYLIPRQDEDKLGTLYKVYGIGSDTFDYRYFTGPKREGATKGIYYQGVPKEKFDNPESYETSVPIENFVDFADSFGNCRHEGGVDFRSGKKPIAFLDYLLKIGIMENKSNIILDFFAGSGSLGHAVLNYNKNNKSNHRFILCTHNENTICTDVCYPRMQNVMNGVNGCEKLAGNLKYFKTNFIDNDTTDKNKQNIAKHSTEMLCLKENCFNKHKESKYYTVFTNGSEKFMVIIYDFDGLEPFIKFMKKFQKKIIVYQFTLDDDPIMDDFEEIKEFMTLETIPSPMLSTYRNIHR